MASCRAVALSGLVLTALGCGENPSEGSHARLSTGGILGNLVEPKPRAACERTVCWAGAFEYPNSPIAKLCSGLPGLVGDGGGSNVFRATHVREPLEQLFSAVDLNSDGHLDDLDPVCDLRLIGHSWGGVSALRLARRWAQDSRIAPMHRAISRVILIDPYRPEPFGDGFLEVPDNVGQVWSYRQRAKEDDCSEDLLGGPYEGMALLCAEDALETRCFDYDLESEDDTEYEYEVGSGVVFNSDWVDHCSIVGKVASWARFNLETGYEYPGLLPCREVGTERAPRSLCPEPQLLICGEGRSGCPSQWSCETALGVEDSVCVPMGICVDMSGGSIRYYEPGESNHADSGEWTCVRSGESATWTLDAPEG